MSTTTDASDDDVPSTSKPAALDLAGLIRDGGPPLQVLLALAAVLYLGFAVETLTRHPLAHTPISDAALYHEWAQRIAAGDLAGPPEPFHHPPLYPYVLGLCYAIAGDGAITPVALQTLLAVAVLLLSYGLARRVAGRAASLWIILALTLYLPLPLFATRLLPATLATALASAGLFVATRPRLGVFGLLGCGALFGALAAARPNQLLAAALVLPILTWRARGRRPGPIAVGGWLLVGLALPIAPFFWHNLTHGGEAILLCDTGGINLYFAHHPDAGASFRTNQLQFGDVEHQAATARAMAEQAEGRPLSFGDVSSHFARRAWRFVIEDPVRELRLLARKTAALASDFEYGIVYCPESERRLLWSSWPLVLPAGLLIALAIGLVVVRGRRLSLAAGIAAAFVAAQWATVLLFFQYSRFRLVSMPAIAMLAAGGLCYLLRWRDQPKAGRTLMAITIALVVMVAVWPADREAREQRALGRVVLAEGYRARGDIDAGLAATDRALRDAPHLVRAHQERIASLRAAGRVEDAAAALGALLPGDRGHPLMEVELARLLTNDPAVRDLDRAIALAEDAVRQEPSLVEARSALAAALLLLGEPARALEAIAPAMSLPTAGAEPFLLAGVAHQRQGQTADAVAAFEEARRRDPSDARPLAELLLIARKSGVGDARTLQSELRRVAPNHPLLQGAAGRGG